ncbi:glycosyltransferase [Frankia sp. CNm7]|uniref:Glycosyltransferase n=2 Tax=Frankia nepalensis TaxID=1836974 RepID=A0A937USF4_9ACTN|nr:glycosyltransferase [Frankia nepalensis]MBL7514646.1 glycosyltransferase [Frankia nepalensis]MBL7521196.1 glycosyltransferase [Frankia nepalensis]MBL7632417.1 glycosyltransferase [Frankia nepalensis]
MFGRADRLRRLLFVGGWLGALVVFWAWWFDPGHLVTPAGFALNTALLAYLCYLPVYFVLTSLRLRRVNPRLPVRDFRVAFVVTKAPSEPWEVVRATLSGMLAQDYPHPYDVWICDEDPDDETYAWCARHGVGVATRHGHADYHRATWPRRTKCKEGNLAFFYDHWGYDRYDVVAQLDADHVPAQDYLAHMVRPFADPKIGYVAAPSVCDANAADSWAARGRLFREANLHGPVQVGSNGWLAPVCFGSHYAVRTTALRDIGGIGPELAEDFSTTYLLCTAGWEGAFALDAEAHGDGPDTFAAALTQEFQWSRSLMVLFTGTFWRHVRQLPMLLRARFLFSLSYYPLLALTTAAGLLLAPIACFTGLRWVNVSYLRFLLLWVLASAVLLGMNAYLRRQRLFRPVGAKLVGWENWLFAMVRWPYVGWGCIAALIQKVRPKPVTFKVTPKGARGVEKLPTRLLVPYIAVCLIAFGAALYGSRAHHSLGYVVLSLLGGLAYLAVIGAVAGMHAVETRRATGARAGALTGTIAVPLLVVALLAALCAVATASTWQAFDATHVNPLDLLRGVSR